MQDTEKLRSFGKLWMTSHKVRTTRMGLGDAIDTYKAAPTKHDME